MRWQKLIRLLRFCFQAIWYRARYGVTAFFYVPAPALRSAIYRDWIVMFFCRPFFKHTVFYWHAAGLGQWLTEKSQLWERWLTRSLLGKPDLSIVLGESCRTDACV